MNEETYFKNRSRESIIDLVRCIRSLQCLNKFPDSQIFKTILIVYTQDSCGNFVRTSLEYLIEGLEKHEKLKAHLKKVYGDK